MAPLPPLPDRPESGTAQSDLGIPVINFGAEELEESSDEELSENYGYELLPQDPEQINNSNGILIATEVVENEIIPPQVSNLFQIPQNDSPQWQAFQDDDNVENLPGNDININAAVIKEVMSNIRLPQSAEPSWLKDVPEEQWKAELDSRISAIKMSTTNEDS